MNKQPDNSKSYKPFEIESKWQEKWQTSGLYEPDLNTSKRPFYNLMMFPYPSAEGLHVGNMYAFTGADAYGRYMRMSGYDVFEPIGLDGFGIHSENYALKVNSHPMEQAQKSEQNFYRQLKSIGNGFAWGRALETYDIDYYRWTQWIFIQLFKAGLAYRSEAEVNWCPSCKTVLADEQVIEGKCERCNSEVEKRMLSQWFFRITEYAEPLLQGLADIDWTEKVKVAQRNWIGKSEGARVRFKVQGSSFKEDYIEVFTTRPDTLYGATFMVVSPEHKVVGEILKQVEDDELRKEIEEYVEQSKKESDKAGRSKVKEDKEKTGVFSGAYALNPVNNKQLPIWIADYVLMGYGTGAIMAVPAHDQRDYEFAKKYDLPIEHVIMPSLIDIGNPPQEGKEYTRRTVIIGIVRDPKSNKYLILNWKERGWKSFVTGGVEADEDMVEAARREIAEETGYTDLKLIRELGGPAEAFFYAAHKGVNRQTKTHMVLFDLVSEKMIEVATNEREQFEAVWLTEEEVVKAKLRHAEFSMIWERIKTGNDVYTGHGVVINSGSWDEFKVPQDISKVIKWLEEKEMGKREVTYHLRDWLISRQRYWGPPIPMIFCEACASKGQSWFDSGKAGSSSQGMGMSNDKYQITNKEIIGNLKFEIGNSRGWSASGWYPEENLPVELPFIDDYKPLGSAALNADGEMANSPLGNHPEFYNTICPHCGGQARRETDVSDTFLDSSWYFLRYLATDLSTLPFPMSEKSTQKLKNTNQNDLKKAKDRLTWLPVARYTGGAEHAVLHLLYTRFIYKVFVDLEYIGDKKGHNEPFPEFFAHGLIIKDGAKMSKSKGNVVIPDAYIKKFGADTLRTYLMFIGPFSEGGDFKDAGIEGMYRFLKRVWVMGTGKNITGTQESASANIALHKAIKGVTEDIGAYRHNTAIAKIMTLYNAFSAEKDIHNASFRIFLQLLAPFAPHMTEELWELHGGKGSIHASPWPEYDPSQLVESEVVIAIQVNGKLRGEVRILSAEVENKEKVEAEARQIEAVKRHLEGKEEKRAIYVPGKILNFVTE